MSDAHEKTRLRRTLCAAVMAAAATVSAAAHHSYGMYDRDRLVEIEGVLEKVDWIAPHALLRVRSEAGQLVTAEWLAPRVLQQRAAVERDTLRAGDMVVLGGNPHRQFAENGVVTLKSVRRPADGWTWPPN